MYSEVLSTPLTELAPVVKASLSPDALKNDCPTMAMFVKIVSVVVLGPPRQPHEQLKFFTVLLSVNIAFKMSFGNPLFGSAS